MVNRSALTWLSRAGALAVVLLAPALLAASDPIKGIRKFDPDHEVVEIFSAAEAGELEIKLFAKDSTECRLLIANKTDRPLNVRLPEALAAVPVLAQAFPDFDILDGGNDRARDSGPQQLGVGNSFGVQGQGNQQLFNMPDRGQGGQNPFFAPFNIAPEKVAQLRLPAVCLEHGKPSPRPAIPYRLARLETVTEEPGVRELCTLLARGEVTQRAAQAAAWHLNNQMSWDELQAKRYKAAFGLTRPYFTRNELEQAEEAVEKAVSATRKVKKPRKRNSLSMR